jgi:HEAT repeat protein
LGAWAFGNDAAAAVPPLLVLLNTADPQTAALIARTLGLIGPAAQRAIPRIIALLDSDNPLTVQFSEEALGRFGTNAAAAIPKLPKREKNRR